MHFIYECSIQMTMQWLCVYSSSVILNPQWMFVKLPSPLDWPRLCYTGCHWSRCQTEPGPHCTSHHAVPLGISGYTPLRHGILISRSDQDTWIVRFWFDLQYLHPITRLIWTSILWHGFKLMMLLTFYRVYQRKTRKSSDYKQTSSYSSHVW